MKKSEVLNCMFPSWYPIFKDYTIKSRILPIPPAVLEYLRADGLVLPDSSRNKNSEPAHSYEDESETSWSDEDTPVAEAPNFPEFDKAVTKMIDTLGGAVFPKLNWSSPKDASWITFNSTLKCTSVSDIYLLLKSSQFVAHDITEPLLHCDDYEVGQDGLFEHKLVLRRWCDLNPAGEFRCFVENNKLRGVCQRQTASFYPHIHTEKNEIVEDLYNFFEDSIKGKYPEQNYVFDVYLKEKGKIYVIDFGTYGGVTDGLLFRWDELKNPAWLKGCDGQENNECPAFRYVDCESGVQPSPYRQYAIPVDFVDLTTGEDPYKLMDLLKLKSQCEDSEDEDETQENNTS